MAKSAKRSAKKHPFAAYQEVFFGLSSNQDLLEDDHWASGPASDYFVDWLGFFAGSTPPIPYQIAMRSMPGRSCTRPLLQLLVAQLASVFQFQRRAQSIPRFSEVQAQLADVRRAAMSLAALAQGNDARAIILENPDWLSTASSDPNEQVILEEFARGNSRSAALHPMLQDHLSMAMEPDLQAARSIDESFFLEKGFAASQERLLDFFAQIPNVLEALEKAEQNCKQLKKELGETERRKGVPGDPARDWVLLRLLWIWRDVLDRDIKIYVRKIDGKVELSTTEPNSCVAFVVDVMKVIEPISPHQLPSLEKKLSALRRKLPEVPLATRMAV